ncbi:Scube1, partial [Symbiodinium necroappetens]
MAVKAQFLLLIALLAQCAFADVLPPDECEAEDQGSCSLGLLQSRAAAIPSLPCAAGQSRPSSGHPCFPCVAGTYGKDGLDCRACRAGSFSWQRGATSAETCETCPAGTWSSQVGATSANACMACPMGRWSN